MHRRLLCSVCALMIATLAGAQDGSAPRPVLFEHGSEANAWPGVNPSAKAAVSCQGCLFYGGDNNCEDANTQGFADENTIEVSDTETLGAVTVPAGKQVVVQGLFFDVEASVAEFDPATATWEIRTGVSEGNGGSQVAAGSAPIQVRDNGNTCGLAVFDSRDTVMFGEPQTLTAGTYWFNLTPQCTNSGDSRCDGQSFYALNTTQGTNSIRGRLQPLHENYFNSAYFGYSYANWCDESLGENSRQCAALSFGLIGTGD